MWTEDHFLQKAMCYFVGLCCRTTFSPPQKRTGPARPIDLLFGLRFLDIYEPKPQALSFNYEDCEFLYCSPQSLYIDKLLISRMRTSCKSIWMGVLLLEQKTKIVSSHSQSVSLPLSLSDRRSTRTPTTSSCCMGATSTTPAVPTSGLTVWSPNHQASSCLTCSELWLQLPW